MNCLNKTLTIIVMSALAISSLLSSCDRLHEDLQPCVSCARLRFVYEYNMEFANGFPKQVDCLTLFVYDAQGNYLLTRTAGKPETEDEDWRMTIDLPEGHYRMLAYGGMECPEASFTFTTDPTTTPMADLEVRMDPRFTTQAVDKPLHHLFYGALDIDIPAPGAGTTYTEETVYMMKDTNDLRILLANEYGEPTDEVDFEFNIITDDALLGSDNQIIPTAPSTYWPWTRGNAELGMIDADQKSIVAWAELSTSRFVMGNPTTLLITRRSDGSDVVRIPLLNLLMLYKSERFSWMGAQEFLDRQSRWDITFFLTGQGVWLRTKIVVNDWVVRINEISDL